jgi:hypothetical protein
MVHESKSDASRMTPSVLLEKLAAGQIVELDGWHLSQTLCSFGPIIETTDPYGVGSGTTSMTLDDCERLLAWIDQSTRVDPHFQL